jgi:quercetin dioxygenase-like cupin family protein
VEIHRFGPGHRRLSSQPGTQNVEGTVIMADDRAVVSEVAFGRYAMIVPHENPDNTALFVVISGAGWVQVGDDRSRVNHGEAVVWPPSVPHGAYTDGTEMRAIIVELMGPGATAIEGTAHAAIPTGTDEGSESREPARGGLAERKVTREDYDSDEGEPW